MMEQRVRETVTSENMQVTLIQLALQTCITCHASKIGVDWVTTTTNEKAIVDPYDRKWEEEFVPANMLFSLGHNISLFFRPNIVSYDWVLSMT
jgi:hypothetical protein